MPPPSPPTSPVSPLEGVEPEPEAVPRDLVSACCEEVGLDPERDWRDVLDALHDPPLRECCDSACDPCILTVVRAASLVRQRRPKSG